MRLSFLTILCFFLISAFAGADTLTGKIWDVKQQQYISEEELLLQLNQYRFVLLGEVHDNRDHHRFQARILDKLTDSARDSAVVFEMVERSRQNAFEIFRKRFIPPAPGKQERRHDASGLELLLDWQNSGWPDWNWYKPLFDIAMLKGLPIGAGGLSRYDVGAVHKQGVSGLSPELAEQLGPWLEIDWPEDLEQRNLEEIREGHCNALPEEILPAFSLIQRLRDASLGERLVSLAAVSPGGRTILIAGNGHVRRDLGVPYYLKERTGTESVASIGQIEVSAGHNSPADYAGEFGLSRLPFAFVRFTEAAKREDPCKIFKSK